MYKVIRQWIKIKRKNLCKLHNFNCINEPNVNHELYCNFFIHKDFSNIFQFNYLIFKNESNELSKYGKYGKLENKMLNHSRANKINKQASTQ